MQRMSSSRLRLGRHSLLAQVYVLTTTYLRRRLFENDQAATCVAAQFAGIEQCGWVRSLAWVVMPDHVHWMFALAQGELSCVARRFKSSSALALNRSSGRRGAVWQAGYFDHAVRADEGLERQARYILGNPIRAGLSTQIGEYPHAWSMWT
ncbi:MAG: REP-associated tyrosine transposase [Stenotrophomonas maltophilia]|uniref:REP-associated tyrosine transposase n=1 Tax=Stenotrophomonas maltophilia TaxID=40324 RepID=A0A7V8FIP3_STEMA|nr:MAG: REP-associated tyrosine transposase [Stenotrophomonas maltophilia]